MKKRALLFTCISTLLLNLSGCGGEEIQSGSTDPSTAQIISSQKTDDTISQASTADSAIQTTLYKTSSITDHTSLSETTVSKQVKAKTNTTQIQITNATTTTATKVTENTGSVIDSRIHAIFAPIYNGGGKYRLKVISMHDNETIDVGNCNGKMTAASLIKLYVAGAVYEHINSIKAYESYSGETEKLISNMISMSDNNACNTLVKRLGDGDANTGMRVVNSFCNSHGFYNTQMNRLMLNFNGLENYTTTLDCCNILKSYYNNELKGSESIIGYMKAQTVRTKIPSGITDGTIVANKTGELASVENDSAIVYSSKGVYIMCAMTQDLSNTVLARNAIVQASATIHQNQLKKNS